METNSDRLQEYLHSIIAGIVLYPDAIEISKLADEMGILYTVKVHADDRGKILGKEGKTATALRTILRVSGFKMDVRAALKIDVPGSNYQPVEEAA